MPDPIFTGMVQEDGALRTDRGRMKNGWRGWKRDGG